MFFLPVPDVDYRAKRDDQRVMGVDKNMSVTWDDDPKILFVVVVGRVVLAMAMLMQSAVVSMDRID